MTLTLLEDRLAICRLDADAPLPAWGGRGGFWSATRTAGELSVICAEERVPAGVRSEHGWRALELEGPFGFDEVGVLLPIAEALAAAGVSILALATFETDYVLVRQEQLPLARARLAEAGHVVRERR